MTFGYLLIISETDKADYLMMAYALALSIKITQNSKYNNIALVTDNLESIKTLNFPNVFDQTIEWKEQIGWDGRSWMDKLSPWDYTVCLDVDMLFLKDYSHVIEKLISSRTDLYLPTNAYTYRNELVTSDFYRKCFTANDLPNIYSFYTFFKKDSLVSKDFFALGRHIIKHPIEFSNLFLSNRKPGVIGTDEAFSLSAKILGIEDTIKIPADFLRVSHLKPAIQEFSCMSDSIFDYVDFYFDNLDSLKIGCFRQENILHYVDKSIINNHHINILESLAWKK